MHVNLAADFSTLGGFYISRWNCGGIMCYDRQENGYSREQ
jgi:hypothetical protein